MSRSPVWRAVGSLTLLATALAVVPSVAAAPAGAAAVAPVAPPGLTATRDSSHPDDFTLAWKPVSGVDHYNVSVASAGVDTVTVLPRDTTKLAVKGKGLGVTYRLSVSSRDAAGEGATSGVVVLKPVLPGAPTSFKVERSSDLTVAKVGWAKPAWLGWVPAETYRVQVTRLSDKKVIAESKTTGTSFGIDKLDPKRAYGLTVAAANAYGSGPAATTVLGSAVPGNPTAITAVRDEKDPTIIHVAWAAPAWTGASAVSHYQVVYGSNTLNKTLEAKELSADVTVPYTITGLVSVRACNQAGCGYLGSTAKAPAKGVPVPIGPGTTTNPFISLTESKGIITFETRGVIGSTSLYPRLYVQVRPTLGNGGFTDSQYGQNGAQTMTFGTVPRGTYWAFVYGVSPKGATTELARKLIVVGEAGEVKESEWKVIRGKADIKGNVVDMRYAGENRVMSTRKRSSQDVVVTTDATLKSGSGYGIWFRSTVNEDNQVAGYTMQYDPTYGNKFLIRHWYKGAECSMPLATSPFPAGFKENQQHKLVVVATGDTVWASVDGIEMFRVASLTAAVKASPCHYPMPTGTEIGFRTWSTSPAMFVGTTLS